jgi:hypothetical protein
MRWSGSTSDTLEKDLEIQPPRTAFLGVGANGQPKALMAPP